MRIGREGRDVGEFFSFHFSGFFLWIMGIKALGYTRGGWMDGWNGGFK
jgi:hypothetical protein